MQVLQPRPPSQAPAHATKGFSRPASCSQVAPTVQPTTQSDGSGSASQSNGQSSSLHSPTTCLHASSQVGPVPPLPPAPPAGPPPTVSPATPPSPPPGPSEPPVLDELGPTPPPPPPVVLPHAPLPTKKSTSHIVASVRQAMQAERTTRAPRDPAARGSPVRPEE